MTRIPLTLGKHFLLIDSPISFFLIDNEENSVYRPSGVWQLDTWKLLPEKYQKDHPVYTLSIEYDESKLADGKEVLIRESDIDLGDGVAGVSGQSVMLTGINDSLLPIPVSVGNFPDNQKVNVSNFPDNQKVNVSNFPDNQQVNVSNFPDVQKVNVQNQPTEIAVSNLNSIPAYPTEIAVNNLPDNQKVNVSNFPDNQKVNVSNFPDNQKVNVSNFPDNQQVNVSNFPGNQKVNVSNFPDVQKVNVSNFPGNQKVNVSNFPDVQKVNVQNQPTEIAVSNLNSIPAYPTEIAVNNLPDNQKVSVFNKRLRRRLLPTFDLAHSFFSNFDYAFFVVTTEFSPTSGHFILCTKCWLTDGSIFVWGYPSDSGSVFDLTKFQTFQITDSSSFYEISVYF